MFLCLVMDVVCLNILSFVKYLDIYQVLPCPYLWSFDGFPGDKLIFFKWALDLASQSEAFFRVCIESRIISDYREREEISQYCTTLKKTGEGKINTTINIQNWGNYFYLYGCHWW